MSEKTMTSKEVMTKQSQNSGIIKVFQWHRVFAPNLVSLTFVKITYKYLCFKKVWKKICYFLYVSIGLEPVILEKSAMDPWNWDTIHWKPRPKL